MARAFLVLLALLLLSPAAARAEGGDFTGVPYAPTTYENVSKLYWAVGLKDLASDADVDGYMRINECGLFDGFVHNDMEWARLRNAARESIALKRPGFPTRFAMVRPLLLGDYDEAAGAFPITQDTAINGMRLFDLRAQGVTRGLCGLGGGQPIPGYPDRFVFTLPRPVRIDSVPASAALARVYVDDVLARFYALPKQYQTWARRAEMREAYLVMKLRFVAAEEEPYQPSTNVAPVPHLLAVLERYDIYADAELTLPLYGQVVRQD